MKPYCLTSRHRLIPIICAAWLLAACAAFGPASIAAEAPRPRAQARLETVNGARVLYLRGAPYERGYEYGRLLANDIKFAISRYLNVGVIQHFGVPRALLEESAAKMERFVPEELKQEMRGISAGARVDYQDVLILNTHVDTVVFADPAGDMRDAPACSGVAVMDGRTSDGRVLHGHNVDWTTAEEIQKAAVLVVMVPEDGVPFCMPTHAGMVGCNAGMNAAGITYSDMTSLSSDQTLDGMPLMLMARTLLQRARTMDEALAFLRSTQDTCGWNMILTAATERQARAVEISAHYLKVFVPGDPGESSPTGAPIARAVVRTNHFVDPEMFALACARFQVPVDRGLVKTIANDTYTRYMALERWVREDARPVAPADIQQWLGTPPVGNPGNVQSMVFDPANQEMWIADAAADGAPACNQRYSHIGLKPYFPH